jgi:hypothetical protein
MVIIPFNMNKYIRGLMEPTLFNNTMQLSNEVKYLGLMLDKATPQLKRLVAGFPLQRPGFNPGSGQVGFVVDNVAPGQVFSEYFGFSSHSFHQILHPHNHLGQAQ